MTTLRTHLTSAYQATRGDDGLVLTEWILLIGVVTVAALTIALALFTPIGTMWIGALRM